MSNENINKLGRLENGFTLIGFVQKGGLSYLYQNMAYLCAESEAAMWLLDIIAKNFKAN